MFSSYDELSKYVKQNNIKMVDFKITDISGRWRHFTIPASKLSKKVFSEGFGFDGSNYGYAKIESSDMVFIPDYTTAFIDPFWSEPTLSFLGNIYEIDSKGPKPFINDPRVILKKAIDYMKNKGIADDFVLGPEYEYYVFDKIDYYNAPNKSGYKIDSEVAFWNNETQDDHKGYKIKPKDGYHIGLPHDVNANLRSSICLELEKIGIDIKYHHHEVGGPGQHEIEVAHGEAFFMADATMKIKYFIKNICNSKGKIATFMPKPLWGEAGNGFHVHMRLFKDNKSIFAGPESNYAGLSDTALYFMGGILKHTPSLMAFVSPSTNSYKRLVKGYEAPIAICFATGNRSSVIRIPGYAKSPQKRRFEFRPSDATSNPYLSFAALLMAGLDGIKNKIDPIKEGFGPIEENIYTYAQKNPNKFQFLPSNLKEALKALAKDHKFLLDNNVFTREFIQNWIYLKEKEIEVINTYPNPKEFELYMDV